MGGQPRVGHPQAAASAATIPNASGKIDGTTAASAERQQRCTRCRCSSGPVEESTRRARARPRVVPARAGSRRTPRSPPVRPANPALRARVGRPCSQSAFRSRRRLAVATSAKNHSASLAALSSSGSRSRRIPGVRRIERPPRRAGRPVPRPTALVTNSIHVHTGRHLPDAVDVTDHVLEDLADVRRSRRRPRARRASDSPSPALRARGSPRIEYSSSEPCA